MDYHIRHLRLKKYSIKNIIKKAIIFSFTLSAVVVISNAVSRGNSGKTSGQPREGEVLGVQDTNSGGIFIQTAQAQTPSLKDEDGSEHKPFEYQVQGGDTLSNIAERFGLKLNTILWANGLSQKSIIRPKQSLTILPIDGVLHTVEKGDTIAQIAFLHKGSSGEIMEYNDISDATKIHAGDMIIVPGGEPSPQAPAPAKKEPAGEPKNETKDDTVKVQQPAASGSLLWPTTTRTITQGYSTSHRGIDISNGGKPEIFASHSGTVEFAGTSGDWGKTIVIRGDDGLVTRYSHNSENYVETGQKVEAGQTVGKVGNTGRVRGRTGLHLDFRVYKNGVAVNPLGVLK